MAGKQENKDVKKEEKSGKGNKAVVVALFLLGLIVLGAATFGGVYLFMKTNNAAQSQPVVIEKNYVDLGEITVNLSDEGGKRYFKGEISIGYNSDDKEAPKELVKEKSLGVVKDAVIFYLKGQKAEFLNDSANEEEIKSQLMEAINKKLTKCKVTDVLFNSIIIQ